MHKQQFENETKKILSGYAGNVFFYWKARVALYTLLKAMNIKQGDEIILPAFTCVVVPNAILYLGAKPIYLDVKKETYNLDINKVKDAITDKTKAIICQNTYGLSTDLNKLNVIAKKYNLYTIEDCTHGFGGTYNNIPNGIICDAAIYSTQWNKPFSTGIGGFSITRDKYLSEKITEFNNELLIPTWKELLNLKLLYFVKRYLLNQFTYWPLVRIFRWLSHNTKIIGSSTSDEITSLKMPEDYFKGFSNAQAKEGIKNLKKLPSDLIQRKESAVFYTDFLKKNDKQFVSNELFDNHSFLKYPILVKNREEFMLLTEKNRIQLGDWFTSPLHPVQGDLSLWQLDRSKYPNADFLSKHVINLPTSNTNIKRVLNFLSKNIDLVL